MKYSRKIKEHIIIGYYPYVAIFFKVILVIQILEVSDIIFVKKNNKIRHFQYRCQYLSNIYISIL